MGSTQELSTGQIVRINPDPYDAVIVDINHEGEQVLVESKRMFTTHTQWVDADTVEVPR